MTPDDLLLWLSAKQQGSWPQFRAAVEKLELENPDEDQSQDGSLPIHQRVRFNLERLGHVEFDTAGCEDGWRVVPPTLALSQHDDCFRAVLCGARLIGSASRLERVAADLSYENISEADCPRIIRFRSKSERLLVDLAAQEGILCQVDAPTAILCRIPSIDRLNEARTDQMPATGRDWIVKQFIVERRTMRWQTITLAEANAPKAQGLFSVTRFQRPRYFIREGQTTISLPGAIGKYLILRKRRRHVLRYSREEHCLRLPAIVRPPLLTERALVLCSGFPPILSRAYGRSMLTYRDIPVDVAGTVAEVLRQDLR